MGYKCLLDYAALGIPYGDCIEMRSVCLRPFGVVTANSHPLSLSIATLRVMKMLDIVPFLSQ